MEFGFLNLSKELNCRIQHAAEITHKERSSGFVQALGQICVDNVLLGQNGDIQDVLKGDLVLSDGGDDIFPQLNNVVLLTKIVQGGEEADIVVCPLNLFVVDVFFNNF